MKHFMIGQYGSFDYSKFNRDFKDGFYGIEACLFGREEDIENLMKESRDREIHVGIHFPFRAGRSDMRDALVLSPDPGTRKQAYELIEQELRDYAVTVRPEYILFHYPKPVVLDDRVNWDNWRFGDSREYVYESNFSVEQFQERSEQFFGWIADQGERYGFVPVLEFDALNRYIYETDLLAGLLDKNPGIKLCLDTGRLYLQDRVDPYFSAVETIGKFAKYAELIHLGTLKYTGKIEYYKHPVLPEQDPKDGWAPIEDYLKVIRASNPHVKIMFEHRSDLIGDEDLDRCYAWVDELMNG